MIHLQSKTRAALSAAGALALGLILSADPVAAQVPSGEVEFAQSRIEPAYDGRDGSFAFLLTPSGARQNTNAQAVSELYVIMYPTQSAAAVGTMICQHQPAPVGARCSRASPPTSRTVKLAGSSSRSGASKCSRAPSASGAYGRHSRWPTAATSSAGTQPDATAPEDGAVNRTKTSVTYDTPSARSGDGAIGVRSLVPSSRCSETWTLLTATPSS